MICAVVSAAMSRIFCRESLYTSVLKQRNIELPTPAQPDWLRATNVQALLETNAARIHGGAPFELVMIRLLELPPGHDLYVTSASGRLLGGIVLEQLKGQLPDHSRIAQLTADSVMQADLPRLSPQASWSEAVAVFAETALERLPVVDASGKLLGTISKSRLLKAGRY
jgi:CIC family chloride channel protein